MGISFYMPDSTPAGIGGIDEYTKLMMHMDGDQSDSEHTITYNGGPRFSTIESKFSPASMYFDGNDSLSIPHSDDWNFGSGDFGEKSGPPEPLRETPREQYMGRPISNHRNL